MVKFQRDANWKDASNMMANLPISLFACTKQPNGRWQMVVDASQLDAYLDAAGKRRTSIWRSTKLAIQGSRKTATFTFRAEDEVADDAPAGWWFASEDAMACTLLIIND